MCAIPNGFRDRVISLYSSKIVDKRDILSNAFIYFFLALKPLGPWPLIKFLNSTHSR
jgi:hypothetical protein